MTEPETRELTIDDIIEIRRALAISHARRQLEEAIRRAAYRMTQK